MASQVRFHSSLNAVSAEGVQRSRGAEHIRAEQPVARPSNVFLGPANDAALLVFDLDVVVENICELTR